MKTPVYFNASLIAQVAKCHLRTINRHAAKQGWPRQRRGNSWEMVPPVGLRAKCLAASRVADRGGLDGFTIGAAIRAELYRANLRFAALCALETAIKAQQPIESALVMVARDFTFRVSPSALRVWLKKYAASGFQGLMESNRRNCGRKAKAQA